MQSYINPASELLRNLVFEGHAWQQLRLGSLSSSFSDLHRLRDYPAEAESLAADRAACIAAHGSLRESRRVAQLHARAHFPHFFYGIT